MRKYSFLELTMLEEKINARIPHHPNFAIDHEPTMKIYRKWEEQFKKELGALSRIKAEIEIRLTEIINESE